MLWLVNCGKYVEIYEEVKGINWKLVYTEDDKEINILPCNQPMVDI